MISPFITHKHLWKHHSYLLDPKILKTDAVQQPPLTRRNETNDWSLSLSLSLAVAVAAMARQEGQTDKKGHTVRRPRHSLHRRCGRLKIELFLPLSPSILSKGAEQTVKRVFVR